jgi:PAS domain S-box-containing protein
VNLTLEQEVAERRRAEETLTRSEARYRLLAENVHDSILTLDLDLRFTYASPSVMRLTGFSPEEIGQLRVEQLFTPESYALARQVLSEELARNRQPEPIDRHVPRTLELELLRKDGGTLWIELTTTFIWDDQARPVNILVVARDISKRKQAEGERERLVRELRQALADVKTLRGLIPICASCKKIRDDQGYWKQIEGYISEHSDAVFSHGICPECMEKLYPGLLEKKAAAPTTDPAEKPK